VAPEHVDLRATDVGIPAFNTGPLVNIKHEDLLCPHRRTAATPSLHLQLDGLSLALDVETGVSGHPLVTHAGDAAVESKEWFSRRHRGYSHSHRAAARSPRGSVELAVRL
jgi:hypothetical protein